MTVEDSADRYDVVLTAVGAKKIQVLKTLRKLFPLGLAEAMKLTESLPATLSTGISLTDANQLAAAFSSAGATVAVLPHDRQRARTSLIPSGFVLAPTSTATRPRAGIPLLGCIVLLVLVNVLVFGVMIYQHGLSR